MKKYKYLIIFVIVITLLTVISINVYASNFKINDITTNYEYSEICDVVTSFDGEQVNIQYKETRINDELNEENYIYNDKLENQYVIDEDGDIVGFISAIKQTEINAANQVKLSSDKRRQICENFLLNQIGNISDYKYFGETFNSQQKYYELTYYKTINGIKTSDFIFIDISSAGDIVAFAAPNMNCFSEIIVPKFTVEDYDKDIVNILNERYPNMISYSITDTILQKNSNSVNLIVYLEVSLADNNQRYKQGDNIIITVA